VGVAPTRRRQPPLARDRVGEGLLHSAGEAVVHLDPVDEVEDPEVERFFEQAQATPGGEIRAARLFPLPERVGEDHRPARVIDDPPKLVHRGELLEAAWLAHAVHQHMAVIARVDFDAADDEEVVLVCELFDPPLVPRLVVLRDADPSRP